jgi:hypothetical protein
MFDGLGSRYNNYLWFVVGSVTTRRHGTLFLQHNISEELLRYLFRGEDSHTLSQDITFSLLEVTYLLARYLWYMSESVTTIMCMVRCFSNRTSPKSCFLHLFPENYSHMTWRQDIKFACYMLKRFTGTATPEIETDGCSIH